LNRLLHQRGVERVVIDTISINPQTGFRPALIDCIRINMEKVNWPEQHLGTNPPLLKSSKF